MGQTCYTTVQDKNCLGLQLVRGMGQIWYLPVSSFSKATAPSSCLLLQQPENAHTTVYQWLSLLMSVIDAKISDSDSNNCLRRGAISKNGSSQKKSSCQLHPDSYFIFCLSSSRSLSLMSSSLLSSSMLLSSSLMSPTSTSLLPSLVPS